MIRVEHLSPESYAGSIVRDFLVSSSGAYPEEVDNPAMDAWPTKLVSNADLFCMRRQDGSLSAALFAYLNNHETRLGYIPFICSLPECEKGTAYALHTAMCTYAESVGMTRIQLEVVKSNTHAQSFYQRQGYKIIADHADRNRWLMELRMAE